VTYQENHHHEAVENGEPMDSVLEEVRVQILVEAILKTLFLYKMEGHSKI
jgi:hypothetical protein